MPNHAPKSRRAVAPAEPPSKQLAGFIAKYEPAVAKPARAAIAQAEMPLPAKGRGRLVIKSVSAKQWPRRRS